jgi:hypothetical protein
VKEIARGLEADGADDALARYVRGEIDAAEARRLGLDDATLEAAAPLGGDFQARLVSSLARSLRAPAPARRAVRRSHWVAGLSAAAAAVLAAVWLTSDAALPPYDDAFTATDREQRSGAEGAGTAVLSEDGILEWSMRPAERVEGAIDVVAFRRREGGPVEPWPVSPELAPEGAVRLRGTPRQLGLTPGRWRLVLAVGRPGAPPDLSEVTRALEAGASSERLFVRDVTVREER